MSPARRRRPGLRAGLVLALAVVSTPAFAQSDRPRHRPQPPPTSLPADDQPGDASSVAAPSPAATGRPEERAAIPSAAPVLRSAIHSRYSRSAVIARSTTSQCRVGCAEARAACADGQGDTSGCDPGWTQCLSGCAGLNYARGP